MKFWTRGLPCVSSFDSLSMLIVRLILCVVVCYWLLVDCQLCFLVCAVCVLFVSSFEKCDSSASFWFHSVTHPPVSTPKMGALAVSMSLSQ